jgi:hypothetical protein
MIHIEINRLSLIEGAQLAVGLTVIIDVFRAFTTDARASRKLNKKSKSIPSVRSFSIPFSLSLLKGFLCSIGY